MKVKVNITGALKTVSPINSDEHSPLTDEVKQGMLELLEETRSTRGEDAPFDIVVDTMVGYMEEIVGPIVNSIDSNDGRMLITIHDDNIVAVYNPETPGSEETVIEIDSK